MKKVIFAVIALFAALCANAQTPTTTIKELNYEQSMNVSRKVMSNDLVWRDILPWKGQVATENGKQIYTFPGQPYKLIFNPLSFASFYAASVPQGLKEETSRQDRSLEMGATWKTTFESPPPPGGECAGTSRYNYSFKVVAQSVETILLNGNEIQTPVVAIEAPGWWNSCGWSGRIMQRVTYSPVYNIVVRQEITTFDPSGQLRLGRGILLKSITTE